jgi:Na+-translocating ferredoxin:NAD+ oxidoreductase subunit C
MSAITFKGGVHPPDGKKKTQGLAVQPLTPPAELVVPLSQHIGAPAKASVEKGDLVMMGQVIAEAGGFVSAAIHAPVSGKVTAIEPRPGMTGTDILSIIIENDGADQMVETKGLGDAWEHADADTLKRAVADAGIVGMGGATFPTHVKLSPPPTKPIDTIILNGAECEPMLTADHRLMLESTDKVVTGLQIALKILGASRGFIGIERNKPDAIEVMQAAVAKIANIEVLPLTVKYPQGAEKQLIDACLNRQVPSGGLPMDVGVLVQNVGTAAAMTDAAIDGRPLIERIVTVSGSAVQTGGNFRARIGTPISLLIEAAGGVKGELGKIIAGGPMMGFTQHTDEIPVTKGTSGVLLFEKGELDTAPPDPCIRCGRCIRACPMRISPTEIATYARHGMVEAVKRADALDCIECGSCSFGCPSRIPLVQEIRLGKALIAQSKNKKK